MAIAIMSEQPSRMYMPDTVRKSSSVAAASVSLNDSTLNHSR